MIKAESGLAANDRVANVMRLGHSGWMVGGLTLRFEFSNDPMDSFGWLAVEVASDSFAGLGGFWVQWQDVAEFGESLRTYPIAPDAPLKVQWGFERLDGEDLRLSIEVGPANATGDLCVQVEVADYYDPKERVRTSFLTHYPQLDDFRVSIAKLMDRTASEASLVGH